CTLATCILMPTLVLMSARNCEGSPGGVGPVEPGCQVRVRLSSAPDPLVAKLPETVHSPILSLMAVPGAVVPGGGLSRRRRPVPSPPSPSPASPPPAPPSAPPSAPASGDCSLPTTVA